MLLDRRSGHRPSEVPMSCCGERWAALRTYAIASEPPLRAAVTTPTPPQTEPESASAVVVEYRGEQPVLLRGTTSGRLYTFSPARRARSVPARDAAQLLRNPLFRLEERRSNGTGKERSSRGAGRPPS